MGMRPVEGENLLRLPVTFDYKGGRSILMKQNLLLGFVLFVISIVSTVIMLKNMKNLYLGIAYSAGLWSLFILFARFKLFSEKMYRDAVRNLQSAEQKPGTLAFWGIYDVSSVFPYICRFAGGKTGIFVRFEKDSIIGKADSMEFRHFEAISEGYNRAGRAGLNMCYIDYMDNVGNDSRMSQLYGNLQYSDSVSMRKALNTLYGNLQDEMSSCFTSYDVYVFTGRMQGDKLYEVVYPILEEMLGGNYLSFSALNMDGIRDVCAALFNLEDFSVLQACDRVVSKSSHSGIHAIKVEHKDGSVEILGKTQMEIRAEELEDERRKTEKKRKGKVKKVNPSEIKTENETENAETKESGSGFVLDDF